MRAGVSTSSRVMPYERTFSGRLNPAQLQEFIALVFYPRETLERLGPALADADGQRAFCRPALRNLFELMRLLARRFPLARWVPSRENSLVFTSIGFQHLGQAFPSAACACSAMRPHGVISKARVAINTTGRPSTAGFPRRASTKST